MVCHWHATCCNVFQDTDFEYSLQATKWESVQLQNNIASIFQRANEPAYTASDIVSILPAASGGYTGSATNTTFLENGRAGMTQYFSGNFDDTNFFINSPFNINFLGTVYTGAFFGSNGYVTFGGGSGQYSNLAGEDQPAGLPGLKWNAADQRIQWLGDITIGTAPNRTWIVRWEGSSFSGPLNSIVVELRFPEGQNNIELHYVANQQQNQNPLANLTVVELKSLAYDNLTRIQQAQSNLQVLNQEIDKRIQAFQQAQQQPN